MLNEFSCFFLFFFLNFDNGVNSIRLAKSKTSKCWQIKEKEIFKHQRLWKKNWMRPSWSLWPNQYEVIFRRFFSYRSKRMAQSWCFRKYESGNCDAARFWRIILKEEFKKRAKKITMRYSVWQLTSDNKRFFFFLALRKYVVRNNPILKTKS